MRSSRQMFLLIAVAAIVVGASLVIGGGGKKTAVTPKPHPPLSVAAEQVQREAIRHWVYGEGKAYAIRREYLAFEKSGKVVFIGTDSTGAPLREGSTVVGPVGNERLGQLLARIDVRDDMATYSVQEANQRKAGAGISSAQADVEQARTDLQVAQIDLDRSKALLKQDAIAAQELESKQASYNNAKAKLLSAQARLRTSQAEFSASSADLGKAKVGLERTGLFAPFNGTVAYLNVRLGDSVAPEAVDRSSAERMSKTAPIVLIDPSQFEVEVDLPPFIIGNVSEGQEAYLFFGQTMITPERLLSLPEDARPPYATAVVYSVTPSISEESRTVQVKLHTVTGAGHLQDGMFVTAWIADAQKDNVLVVPVDTMVFSDGRASLFAFEAAATNPDTSAVNATAGDGSRRGKAVEKFLPFGLQSNSKVEVLSGVAEGDWVITEGKHLLVNGSSVQVVETDRR